MSSKLEMNREAAKMLGRKQRYICPDCQTGWDSDGHCPYVPCGRKLEPRFDIFTNPSDCLEAVKRLGDTHGIYISHSWIGNGKSWGAFNQSDYPLSYSHDTYEEAVGAACVEVMK